MTLRKKDGTVPVIKWLGSAVVVLTCASLALDVTPKVIHLLEVPATVEKLVTHVAGIERELKMREVISLAETNKPETKLVWRKDDYETH